MKKIFLLIMLICISMTAAACGGQSKSASTTAANQSQSQSGQLVVKMLDIGQGDAILIKSPTETILVDSGDVDKRDDIVRLLKKENISTIDKLIITHPHADHLGGAYAVLKNFKVKEVYDNGQTATSNTYKTYLKLIKEQKIAYKALKADDKLELGGGAVLELFNPTEAEVKKGGELNSNSLVGKLVFNKFSMLLTGDCEADREKELLAKYGNKLQADILKSPHHGSKTSSNRNFLKAVAPQDVLISCGNGNDYGHPHKETMNKYKDLKLNIYRTDINGTITVTSDGSSYQITKEK